MLNFPSGHPIPLHSEGLYGVPLPLLYLPNGQAMQAELAFVLAPGGLYVLCVVQFVPLHVPCPFWSWNFPPGHAVHVACDSTVAPTMPNVPVGHSELVAVTHTPVEIDENVVQQRFSALVGAYLPDGQSSHTSPAPPEPPEPPGPLGLLLYLPGAHPVPTQPSCPFRLWCLPAGHVLQLSCPSSSWYVPVVAGVVFPWQSTHVCAAVNSPIGVSVPRFPLGQGVPTQAVDLAELLNVPASQLLHTTLLVLAWNLPAGQSLHSSALVAISVAPWPLGPYCPAVQPPDTPLHDDCPAWSWYSPTPHTLHVVKPSASPYLPAGQWRHKHVSQTSMPSK